ncbi:hypothetical protein [Novosphingobium album (ex Liu et al. 2023)]|uniref:Lipoprotein n=1 Tax=Novosphingobium album (ex Liu et al. 2023) TaxID=3031130 RepID=A0ABT5WTT6_9SPHN|nr:hypothetical protein [Novosphingobium album (ex Liu et al. 2023)]MDE8653273.1 hypothetical protein [Novosphingobium album (ex Liu et al. 2023)]
MRTIALFAVTAVALALGACSKEPAGPEGQASETPAEAASEAPLPEDTASEAVSEPEPVAAKAIPQAIRGRWGLVAADCTSTMGDAKGLLTIGASELRFYESVATLGKIQEADAERIRASYTFSGEGQTWTQDVVLGVQDQGKTLIRRDYGPDAMPGALTYTRCQ